MQKNTPQLWDNLWKETSKEEDLYNLKREENSVRWKRIEKLVLRKFKSFKNLKVIEVGAGAGTLSLLFAKKKAKITILDYSKKAIARSRVFFSRHKEKANFILADALNLPSKLKGKYDVAMSFGLAEHFQGKQRTEIIKSHFDLIDKGLVIISVPYKYNFPYQLNKTIRKILGLWKFGEEYPYSRKEFLNIAKKLNVKHGFINDSFFTSLRFINPFLLIRRKKVIKKEKSSFLDRFSYALIFVGDGN